MFLYGIATYLHNTSETGYSSRLSNILYVSLQTVAGGEYYHFGILAGIMSQLQSQQCNTVQQCILLQTNIDGLPLFKSSNLQFWPILRMVDNMPSKIHSSLAYSVVLKSHALFQSL